MLIVQLLRQRYYSTIYLIHFHAGSKVSQLQVARFIKQHVVWLYIPVGWEKG